MSLAHTGKRIRVPFLLLCALLINMVVGGYLVLPAQASAVRSTPPKRTTAPTKPQPIQPGSQPIDTLCREMTLILSYTPASLNIVVKINEANVDPSKSDSKGFWQDLEDAFISFNGVNFSVQITQTGGLTVKGVSVLRHSNGKPCISES